MDDLISRQAAIDAILHITNCKSVRELFEYNQEHHLTEMWSGGVNDAIDAVIGVESATDNNVGTELSTNLAEVGTDVPDNNVGELMSKQQAIDAVMECYDNDELFEVYEQKLNELPTIQPKRGRWNKISPANIYECSVCGQNVMTQDIDVYRFCHGCGADMREVTE